jgi:hypothetical protein
VVGGLSITERSAPHGFAGFVVTRPAPLGPVPARSSAASPLQDVLHAGYTLKHPLFGEELSRAVAQLPFATWNPDRG